ncbi:hypothetical protein AGMMS49574_24290 [Bacteroidia bacterium]|nr:hypothetical protein AGMMS49574_24290 [Bacteroidia bacterium]
MQDVAYLSSAYLGPVQYYCKLYGFENIYIETAENYLKQTYRNRCTIAGANGPLSLSIPIEKPDTLKCLTRDIRISDHGNWQHLHWNALSSAYNTSPYFEYYTDDFIVFYEKRYDFLFDFNEQLRELVCELVDLHPIVHYTTDYLSEVANDFREAIRPKHPIEDTTFHPTPYYQIFSSRYGFIPNLSIVDLLFNTGPEGSLILRDSIRV